MDKFDVAVLLRKMRFESGLSHKQACSLPEWPGSIGTGWLEWAEEGYVTISDWELLAIKHAYRKSQEQRRIERSLAHRNGDE